MIYFYKILGLILIPIIKIHIKRRIKKGKEISNRYKERFGISNASKNSSNKIIWIHAASVGEFKSATYLINLLSQKYTILITTTTVSAANYATEHYKNKIIHQFAPLDISFWVNNFLNKWNPSLIIWIESDLWPITLHIIKKRKINSILLNLRMSPKSYKLWKVFSKFYTKGIECFDEIYAQSKLDQSRIISLTKKNIKFIGNLKFASLDLNNNTFNVENYKNNTLVNIIFVSTHKNEEIQFLPIIKKLINKFPKTKYFIAPRHPERAEEIIRICNNLNLSTTLENIKQSSNKNITIINSFGKLSKYYKLNDIVFLGGSITNNGGHNPIEPAMYKCAILSGKNVFNWQNIYEDMELEKSCIKIETTNELEIELNNLIINDTKIKIMKDNAYKYAKKQFFDKALLETIIEKYI